MQSLVDFGIRISDDFFFLMKKLKMIHSYLEARDYFKTGKNENSTWIKCFWCQSRTSMFINMEPSQENDEWDEKVEILGTGVSREAGREQTPRASLLEVDSEDQAIHMLLTTCEE